MNTATLEDIITKLYDRKLSVIAEQTGLSTRTLADIRDKKNKNPTVCTLEKIAKYFEQN